LVADGREGLNVMTKVISLMGKLHYKYAYKPRITSLTSLFIEKLFPADRVLDVGCGSGILGARWERKGGRKGGGA